MVENTKINTETNTEIVLQKDLSKKLVDKFSRPLTDLRISVIDRCNLRCTYCMPKKPNGEVYKFLPKADLLSFDEICRIVKVLAKNGLQKIRLTGGEPLLRKNLDDLIRELKKIHNIKEVALTTNGVFLKEQIASLVDAGLDRVTLSLDAIDPALLNRISGRPVDLENIYAGIEQTLNLGIKVKINSVIQKQLNDTHFLDLLEKFRGTDVEVRLIEFMDVGMSNNWQLDKVVPSKELIKRIEQRWPLEALGRQQINDVASRYRYTDGQGTIGFISSISQPFCGNCSRARLSSEGQLYNCLFAKNGLLLRDKMRSGISDAKLENLLTQNWAMRSDRYSEERSSIHKQNSLSEETATSNNKPEKIEMFYIGG